MTYSSFLKIALVIMLIIGTWLVAFKVDTVDHYPKKLIVNQPEANNLQIESPPSPSPRIDPDSSLAGWKTYTDHRFNYQIDYPSKWSSYDISSSQEPYQPKIFSPRQDPDAFNFNEQKVTDFWILIEKVPTENDQTLFNPKDLFQMTVGQLKKTEGSGVTKLANTKINGFQAVLYETDSNKGIDPGSADTTYSLTYLIKKDSDYFEVIFSSLREETALQNKNVFTKMAMTFKFKE